MKRRPKPRIDHCRLCDSAALEDLGFGLGDQVPVSFPAIPDDGEAPRVPLTLTLCSDCELLQLRHNPPRDFIYDRYWYRSGMNDSMRKALMSVVIGTLREVRVKRESPVWLDIGANDGTLLAFTPPNWIGVGVEPAKNLTDALCEHADYVIDRYWDAEDYINLGLPKAAVVSAIAILYAQPFPNEFVADVKTVLAEDGVFVAQLMTLKQMLRNNDIGNVCHEHLEYFSYANLVQLFERNGLEIFRVEENDVNGGSYRIYARHYVSGSVNHDEMTDREDVYWWVNRVQKAREDCVTFIEDAVADGAKVWVYGASTKGSVILQYYGLTANEIEAAADKNPEKVGRYIGGTDIPIRSEQEFREAQPDYALMLPYGFRDEFIRREEEWSKRGGQWLIPFPQFEVV